MSEPMFGDVQAILFDLDGTLIDSAPDLGAAADKMRTDRGMPSLPLEKLPPSGRLRCTWHVGHRVQHHARRCGLRCDAR